MNTKEPTFSTVEKNALYIALLVISAIPIVMGWKLWPRFAFPLMALTAGGFYLDWRFGRAFGGHIKKFKAQYAVMGLATIAVFWWGI